MINFSEEQIQRIWEKANTIKGYDSAKYRKDVCGAWMIRSQYDKANNLYGWAIDQIIPYEKGGTYDESNLRALQYQNSLNKSGGKLLCLVRATDNGNYELEDAQLVAV